MYVYIEQHFIARSYYKFLKADLRDTIACINMHSTRSIFMNIYHISIIKVVSNTYVFVVFLLSCLSNLPLNAQYNRRSVWLNW